MDENRKDDIEEDVNSNKSIDKIQTDIDILLTGGGIDYTHEVNRMLIQGIDEKIKDWTFPIR